MIQWGKQDMIFAGGCEELDWTLSVLFDAMGAIVVEVQSDRPTVASRAYDADRDGFVICGRRRRAGPRGARPRQGARRQDLWRDCRLRRHRGRRRHGGAVRRGRDALHADGAAKVEARSTTSIRTRPRPEVGDLKEIEAIREVFGAGEKCPPIAATKSLTGHSQGATGVHEAIYSLLMMQNGFICESAHIDESRSGIRRHADPARAARQREARLRAVELVRLRRHQCVCGVQASRCLRRDDGQDPRRRGVGGG